MPGNDATDQEQHLLLLKVQDAQGYSALVAALRQQGLDFELRDRSVLLLPDGRARLPFLTPIFQDCFSAAALNAARAAFVSRALLSCPQRLMNAVLEAEPLARVLEQAQSEWVRPLLRDDHLYSDFHAILGAESGEVFGYEALLRARDPETQAIIGAGAIIAASERLHLQNVLDQRARRAAIRGAAALDMPGKRIFINFLPNTIYDPAVCLRTTMAAAAEYNVPLSQLVFEVVETEKIPNLKRLQHILEYYRERGAGTAVDDMGAGFSSLKYLTTLRPDFVKIDRKVIVRAAEGDAVSQTLIKEIIACARDLGIQVIAEGIETLVQWEMAREAGADYVQGYLFGRPANPPQTVTLARTALPAA